MEVASLAIVSCQESAIPRPSYPYIPFLPVRLSEQVACLESKTGASARPSSKREAHQDSAVHELASINWIPAAWTGHLTRPLCVYVTDVPSSAERRLSFFTPKYQRVRNLSNLSAGLTCFAELNFQVSFGADGTSSGLRCRCPPTGAWSFSAHLANQNLLTNGSSVWINLWNMSCLSLNEFCLSKIRTWHYILLILFETLFQLFDLLVVACKFRPKHLFRDLVAA